MGATSGAGTAYLYGTPESTPDFSGVHVTRSLVLYVCFVDLLVLAIVLSVLLRFANSDYLFRIFKLF